MQLETLWDAWVQSVRIEMRCAGGKGDGMKKHRECAYSANLDVSTLLCTRGPNFPIAGLRERLMCPMCHSRRVRVLISLPSNADAKRAAK